MLCISKKKIGYEVPKNNSYEHDIQLDESNKHTKWQEKFSADLDQQMKYETCKDLGRKSKAKPRTDFKKVRVHLFMMSRMMDVIKIHY